MKENSSIKEIGRKTDNVRITPKIKFPKGIITRLRGPPIISPVAKILATYEKKGTTETNIMLPVIATM